MATFIWSNVNGGNWSDDGNWVPAGVPGPADTALIVLAGQYAISLDVAEIGSVTLDAAGVTLTPTGRLKLDGSLDVKAGTLAVSQTIRGGTLIANGGTINYIGGTLDGVTLNGALILGATNSVTIQDGITFSGAGPEQILVDGTLHLADNETLSNVAITLDGLIDTEHSNTLTLSASTTLTGQGTLEGTTDNKGTITIDGGYFGSGYEPMGSLATALINEGTITLSGGAQARIDNLSNFGTILLSGPARR